MNEILIYGSIGNDGTTDTNFISQLDQFKGQDVKFRLNCPGGDVFQGYAMYNAIKEHGKCDIYIDGLAASMASIIMLAGRRIYAAKNAMIMIHNPSIGDFHADSKKLKSISQSLDKVKQLAIDSYSERTGITEEALVTMLDDETWFTAQEALELGFIDEITDEVLEATPTVALKSKTPDLVFLCYKKKPFESPKSLTAILGLSIDSDNDKILSAINSLKNRSVALEAENNRIKKQIKLDQQKEAKSITDLAIEKGVINKGLERIQLNAFDIDFRNTKADLLKAISEVEVSSGRSESHRIINEIVLGSKSPVSSKTPNDSVRPKSEWTLRDYRKHAPKDLENNRELYNKLIKKEYKQ